MINEDAITYFGETDARNRRVKFGIKAKDRTKHVYVIGKTGMGKSTVLENMAVQDIQNGEGMAFIDPHGKTADLLLDYIPEHRKKDIVYFAPFDLEYPISFNVLEAVDADKRHLVVSGLMSTFKKIWQDAWSARMEYILTNTLLALLEYPNATLLGVNRMYADKEFRKDVIAHITDPTVKAFWTEEFAKYTDKFAAEATPAIQNKIGQFTSNALIRNMIGQPKSSFDLRQLMDEKRILIINLSKGRVGEQNANLLGGMLITKIYLAAMSRADASAAQLKALPQFYLYVDEFQSFANESFADILSEARKYKLNLTIAHQYIEQMEEEVRAAVFGNVGTMIVFRVGAYDAEVLEKEFSPTFTAEDIVNLGVYQIYLKLMIDGVSSQPFSATTLPPIALPEKSLADEVKGVSRQNFAHPRAEVEKAIAESLAPIRPAPSAPPAPAVPQAPRPAPSPVPRPPLNQTPPPAVRPSQPKPAAPAPRPVPPLRPAPAPKPQPSAAPAPRAAPAPLSPAQEAVNAELAAAMRPVGGKAGEPNKAFAAAFRTMEKDSIPARAKEIEGPIDVMPQVTLVRDPAGPRSVPLSSLAKPGPKEATPERRNALQAALAKAMAASKDEPKQEAPAAAPSPKPAEPKPATPAQAAVDAVVAAMKAPSPAPMNAPAPAPRPPIPPSAAFSDPGVPEVPEDLLKKTLAIE